MVIRDILLALTTCPDPTPVSAVEGAASFATSVGSHIAAILEADRCFGIARQTATSCALGRLALRQASQQEHSVMRLRTLPCACER